MESYIHVTETTYYVRGTRYYLLLYPLGTRYILLLLTDTRYIILILLLSPLHTKHPLTRIRTQGF